MHKADISLVVELVSALHSGGGGGSFDFVHILLM